MPKPSFGCMACRQRRVKCDERAGGCLKCERYRIRCPGYQHPLDVLLRHHSKGNMPSDNSLPEWMDLGLNGYRNSGTENDHTQDTRKASEMALRSQPMYVKQPSIELDQAALGAYYTAYCVSSSTLCSLDHIRKQGNGCLWAAIKILGLLQLHQTWDLPEGSNILLKQYTNATTLLNTALASPLESLKDYTLLATQLLSVVEMKASPDFSLHYWLVHTNGAATLMEFRGPNQILNRLGSALFFQISSQLVIYSLLGKRHIPNALQNLRGSMQTHVISNNHPLWLWHGLMYRFANIWADANADNPDATEQNGQAMIAEALSILRGMDLVFQNAGKYWEYTTQHSYCFHPVISYEHVYHSLLTMRVWNDHRIATILLSTLIIRMTSESCSKEGELGKQHLPHVREAYEAIQNAALESLAAVPQTIAGLTGKTFAHIEPLPSDILALCDSNSEYDEQVFQQTRQECTLLPYMDTCKVQWSVYFAVQCEFVEPQIRCRLLEVLESAGKILQIQQWQILADSVRSNLAFRRGTDSNITM